MDSMNSGVSQQTGKNTDKELQGQRWEAVLYAVQLNDKPRRFNENLPLVVSRSEFAVQW